MPNGLARINIVVPDDFKIELLRRANVHKMSLNAYIRRSLGVDDWCKENKVDMVAPRKNRVVLPNRRSMRMIKKRKV